MIWLAVVGTINQSELCWLALTNQIHTHVVGKILCSDAVTRWHSDAVVEGKSNDWLVWWQGARQMTDWFGGRGQDKWLTNTVMRWCGDVVMWWCNDTVTWWCSDEMTVVEGKSNDWLVWWQGARQMTDWFGGRGQGKWLTGLVAVGKVNDWLTRWHSDAVMWWHGDVVVEGKSNDWLVWWQGASQMTDWFGGRGKANDWLVWWQEARQMTDWFGGSGQGKWLTNKVMQWCGDAVMRWCGGRGQVKWLTGLVAGVKANDWLVWWQGARQMTD